MPPKNPKAKPKASDPKRRVGRPSKFATIDRAQVEKLAKAGWTNEQMADFFGVNAETWYEWQRKNGKFSEAIKDWKYEADHRVERSLYERATGYSHPEYRMMSNGASVEVEKHYPPDTAACIFWLKNRKPTEWRDKREHGIDGDNTELIAAMRAIAQRLPR